ncbi:hypothetical protein ABEB36_009198 [Hypothenemus hampei]|uniref:Uncharacterized protein n=1 Tax=Hypothenemus hampei TaxID=57062 RepID=A0ABD1EPI6_HYPHA
MYQQVVLFSIIMLNCVIFSATAYHNEQYQLEQKRSAIPERLLSEADYPDYQMGVRYDEYPSVTNGRKIIKEERKRDTKRDH